MISLPRLRIDWTEPGIVVSGIAHLALLLAAVVSFSQTKPFDDAQEAVAVDMISPSQFSQLTKGEQTAKEAKPEPKPRADKVADAQEAKPEAVDPKRDVPSPPPRPQDPPPEPKPVALPIPPTPPERPKDPADDQKARAEAAAQAKAEAEKAAAAQAKAEAAARAKAEADAQAKAEAAREEAEALEKARVAKAQAEAKARAEAKAKAEAEARAKAEAEAEQKRKEAELARQKAAEAQKLAALAEQVKEPPKPAPKPVPAKPESKFDVANIEKLLTSKEPAQQAPSAAKEVNRTASLGAPKATGVKLTPSQVDALSGIIKDQITRVWSPPQGMTGDSVAKPKIRIKVNPDGTLAAEPVVLNAANDPASRALADSAVRAVKRAAPFRIPPQYAAAYQDWGDWTLNFDPQDLL